jgi:hypothetical protein
MDFKVRIRTDTPLFFLHKQLKERHGRMKELQLYRKSVNEDNLMTDEFKTFEDYGVPGGPKNSAPVVRATLRACVRACVRACDRRARVRACVPAVRQLATHPGVDWFNVVALTVDLALRHSS